MFNLLKFQFNLFAKYSKSYIILSIIRHSILVATPLVNLIFPMLLIDALTESRDIQLVIRLIVIIVLINLISGLINNILNYFISIKTNYVFRLFQVDMANKVSLIDFEALESKEFLETQAAASKFLYSGGRGFGEILQDFFALFGKIFMLIGVVIILSSLNIVILIVFIIFTVITAIIEFRTKKILTKIDFEKIPIERRTGYYMGILTNFIFGKELRVFNANKWICFKYDNHLKKAQEYYKKSRFAELKAMLASLTIATIKEVVSYAYLITEFFRNNITLGSVTMYINSINNFTGTLNSILSSYTDLIAYMPYYDAVKKFFEWQTMSEKGGKKPVWGNSGSTIEFKNVSFKYSGSETYALKDVWVKLELGKKYSIVGINGAGKSTFIKLITRLYEPTHGEILINGVNIKDINYESYMKLFSTVFQDYKLFSFSLSENVALNDTSDDEKKSIINVLNNLGLGKKIETLNKGINTNIYKNFDETGFEPSGGESQKIAIARAFYKNSPIIILDEPTSALDPKSEYELYYKFDKLVKNKTALYISHRLGSTKFCDEIFVFDKGSLIEKGNHDTLIKNDALYKKLYNMQSSYYR